MNVGRSAQRMAVNPLELDARKGQEGRVEEQIKKEYQGNMRVKYI